MNKRFDNSVIIPTFNRSEFISETIESLLRQELPFSEIIVVDDGSDDETHSVLESYGKKIRVINTPNRGVQHARNTGVKYANSEWVTFCDSDDILLPNFTRTYEDFITNNPQFDLLYTNFKFFGSNRSEKSVLENAPFGFFDGAKQKNGFYIDIPKLFVKILHYQPLWPTGLSIRRDAFHEVGGFDPRFRYIKAEDFEFTLRAISCLRTAICMSSLALIRRHPGNDSSDSLEQTLGEIIVLEHVLNTVPYAKMFEYQILKSIRERRKNACIGAYEQGNLDLCCSLIKKLGPEKLRFKIALKFIVANLPKALRIRVWRFTRSIAEKIYNRLVLQRQKYG